MCSIVITKPTPLKATVYWHFRWLVDASPGRANEENLSITSYRVLAASRLPNEGGNYWASIDSSQMLAFSHNACTHEQICRLRNPADWGFSFCLFAKACALKHLVVLPSLGQKWLFLWISLLPFVSDTNKTRAQMWRSFRFFYFLESRSGCYLLMGSVYSTPVIHKPSPKICHFHILSTHLINYFLSWNQLKFNFFICSWRKCNLTTINER